MILSLVWRWLRARITLGWALVKHLLMGPWAKHRSDPTRWLRRIGAEHLGATPKDNWSHFAGSSKCVGCGLCDLFGNQQLPRPSLLIQGAARLPSDAPFVTQASIEALKSMAQDVARICPQGVDVGAIHAIIDNNKRALTGG